MRNLKYFLSNWLWMQLSRKKYKCFLDAVKKTDFAQRDYLLNNLKKNAFTEYGRKYGFDTICSAREYQQRVPLTEYESYAPYIEKIAKGAGGILTRDPVLLFEPSSGSASPSKLIPYTASLKHEFQMGIAPWICSLFRQKPALIRGLSYWSISPPVTTIRKQGVIPVGFEDDKEYLGIIGQTLLNNIMAVPGSVVRCKDPDEFWVETLAYLMFADRLTMISVWSPTFLLNLLGTMSTQVDRVLKRMSELKFPDAGSRIKHITQCFNQTAGAAAYEKIWPDLSVISCWTDGPSETDKNRLNNYFPKVEIQGKGLIATEAFVSLPFRNGTDPVLAVNSHFFEFQDHETGEIKLAHELINGGCYSVIVTTGGGLYRYQLKDLIRVTGFIHTAPTFRFLCKENSVSDLYGEKLHPEHINRSVREVLAEFDCHAMFLLLAPVRTGNETFYTLFIKVEQEIPCPQRVIDALEMKLCSNFHYAHCRNLRQLGKIRFFLIEPSTISPEHVYLEEMHKRGVKFGDIKPSVVDSKDGWETRFPGKFIGNSSQIS